MKRIQIGSFATLCNYATGFANSENYEIVFAVN